MTSYIILIVVVIVLIVCIIAMLSVFMQRKVVETSSTNSDIIYSGAANHFLNGRGLVEGYISQMAKFCLDRINSIFRIMN